MVEAAEAYDLEILNGFTIVRTVSGLITTAFTYANAMQTDDFGGPVTALSVHLYQFGALGRGVPLTQTLTIKEFAS